MSLRTVDALIKQYNDKELTLTELLHEFKQLPGAVVLEEDQRYMVSGKILTDLLNTIKDLLLEDVGLEDALACIDPMEAPL